MVASMSTDQVASYRRDGFFFPIRVASADLAADWRRQLEDAERRYGKMHYLPKPHLVLPLAYAIARDPAVLDAVESILGPDILLWDCSFIIKEAGDGKKVSWHQDLTYWGLEPDDVVSIWLALSPATDESGCMLMMPGTQTGPIVAHRDTLAADNILSRGQTIALAVDEDRAAHVVLAPGEMSLHHGRVWHGSKPNRSNGRRIGFNAQYIAPWVRQVVGDWDSALLVRGEDHYGHFSPEAPPSGDFIPNEVARQEAITARRAAYLRAGAS